MSWGPFPKHSPQNRFLDMVIGGTAMIGCWMMIFVKLPLLLPSVFGEMAKLNELNGCGSDIVTKSIQRGLPP